MKEIVVDEDYSHKSLVLTKNMLKKFEILPYRRKIRPTRVLKIYSGICSGVKLPTISVNEINGKWALLDGNHRYEAIKRFFDKHPRKKVKITLNVYKIKDDRKVKDLFHLLNDVAVESTSDYLKVYIDDISIFDYINDKINVLSVYGSSKKLRFSSLLLSYLGAKFENRPSCRTKHKYDLAEEAMKLGPDDADLLVEFLTSFRDVFGDFGKRNLFSRTTSLSGIMRAYVDNCILGNMGKSTFWYDIMKKVFPDPVMRDDALHTGQSSQLKFHEDLLKAMNKKKKIKRYVYIGRTGKEKFFRKMKKGRRKSKENTGRNKGIMSFTKDRLLDVLPQRKEITYREFVEEYMIDEYPDVKYSVATGALSHVVSELSDDGIIDKNRIGREIQIVWKKD